MSGKLRYMKEPLADENTRLEAGFVQGDDISVYYDSMIAKLICNGRTREEALRKLDGKLKEYHVGKANKQTKKERKKEGIDDDIVFFKGALKPILIFYMLV